MKSAFELALERTGGQLRQLSDEKKKKLAELDAFYRSKIAEAELSAERRLKKEEDPVKALEIREGLVTEIASIKDKMEREKEKVRAEE